MPIIQWNDNLSVGIDTMDEQHKKLVNLINLLFDAIEEGKGRQVLDGVLSELMSYTRDHFSAEEQLMQDYNFPGLADHKEMHRKLLDDVSDFCIFNRFNGGDPEIPVNLCKFLQGWLKTHTSSADKLYSEYITSQTAAAR